jgi:ketosteroid isomerase-like protein
MDQTTEDHRLRVSAGRAALNFGAAIAARDARAAAVTYSTEARLLAPSVEPIEGRDAIAAFWRAGIDAGIRDVQHEPVQLEERGSVAFEFGRYAIRLEPDEGGPLVEHGKYLLVHELHIDGSWQRVVEMLSPDGPPQASAPAHRNGGEKGAGD